MDDLDRFIKAKIKLNALIYGNHSVGKAYHTTRLLNQHGRRSVLIDCSCIVDLKLLLNKIYYQITEEWEKFDGIEEFTDKLNEKDIDVVVVLKNLQELSVTNTSIDLFKLFNSLSVKGLQILFIVSSTTIPSALITPKIMKFYFPSLKHQEVIDLLEKSTENIPQSQSIVRNYIKIIVDTYFPFTTDVKELMSIVAENWPNFAKPMEENPDCNFAHLYSAFRSQLTEKLIETTVVSDSSKRSGESTKLSPLSSILVAASYLASYNDPKSDFTIFSKLKEIRSGKRTFARRVRNGNVRKIVNAMRWFEFERAISIVKSICKDTEYYSNRDLKVDLAMYTEFSNLVTLKLLVRNENKYKVNCNFSYVKSCCDSIGLDIATYLADL